MRFSSRTHLRDHASIILPRRHISRLLPSVTSYGSVRCFQTSAEHQRKCSLKSAPRAVHGGRNPRNFEATRRHLQSASRQLPLSHKTPRSLRNCLFRNLSSVHQAPNFAVVRIAHMRLSFVVQICWPHLEAMAIPGLPPPA
jgi:hypothetical protein